MSLHKSLVSKAGLTRHRNVLKRSERILKLQEEEKWGEDMSVFGLPKVRNMKMKKKPKVKAKTEEEAAAEAAEAGEGAETAEKPGAE